MDFDTTQVLRGLMPTDETGAQQFLEDHPEFDGRGIVVAVLDTGVDPSATGLQTTTTGQPKVIDVVECTGSGDVGMGPLRDVVPGEDGSVTVTGATGRQLRLNPEWGTLSQVRVGAKAARELWSGAIKRRLQAERKEEFATRMGALLLEARAALRAAEAKEEGALPVSECKARVEMLEKMSSPSGDDDVGTVYDVVAFHDGEVWRAAVDTSGVGDMTQAPALSNFRMERQYATFGEGSSLTYAINVYDEGATVSIVTDAGSHGTHVAGIVGANHPTLPEQSGVAPGCQIISCKIGDTRLGSMETIAGLMRGVRAVVENGAHIVNLSFGEMGTWSSWGPFIKEVETLVNDRGVIFISSAGNAGPALSTVGAPVCASPALIGVGAIVSPSMAAAEYGARSATATMHYPWSSRGPCIDGNPGPSLSAPGSAVAPIPTWNLRANQQMNGTSMASPNAAGCCALLLSAAWQSGLAWTPRSAKLALENSATWLPGSCVWALGRGVVNVPGAWEVLQARSERAERFKAAQAARAEGQAAPGVVAWAGVDPASRAAEAQRRSATLGASPDRVEAPAQHEVGSVTHDSAAAAAAVAAGGEEAEAEAAAAGEGGAEEGEEWRIGVVGPSRLRGAGARLRGEDWTEPELTVKLPYQGAGAGGPSDVGVYWREPHQSASASDITVFVTPLWHERVHPRVRTLYQRRFHLVSTEPWVHTATFLQLASSGGHFAIRVDPRQLPAGAHYAEVQAFAMDPEAELADGDDEPSPSDYTCGVEFRVPITIIRPEAPVAASPDSTHVRYCFQRNEPGAADHTSTNSVVASTATAAFLEGSGGEDAASKGGPNSGKAPAGGMAAMEAPEAAAAGGSGPDQAGPTGLLEQWDAVADAQADAQGVARSALLLRAGRIHRRFLEVPEGATWCDIVLERVDNGAPLADQMDPPEGSGDQHHGAEEGAAEAEAAEAAGEEAGEVKVVSGEDAGGAPLLLPAADCDTADRSSRILILHAITARRNESQKFTAKELWARVLPGQQAQLSVPVSAGQTLEVDLAQFWSSLGATAASVLVTFKGVAAPAAASATAASPALAVPFRPLLHSVLVKPSAKFTKLVRFVAASAKGKVQQTRQRDASLDGKRPFELINTYQFDHAGKGSLAISPSIGRVHGLLYDCPYTVQQVLVTGEDGRQVGFSDTYGDSITLPAPGKYTIRARVVHQDKALLESLQSEAIALTVSTPALALKAFENIGSAQAAGLGGGTLPFGRRRLPRDVETAAYFALPAADKLPAEAKAGDLLLGTANIASYATGSSEHPSGEVKLTYTVPARPSPAVDATPAAGGGGAAGKQAEESAADVVERTIRDASIAALASLKGNAEAADLLFEQLQRQHPGHLPLLAARMEALAAAWPEERRQAVVQAADAYLAAADPAAVRVAGATRAVSGGLSDLLGADEQAAGEAPSEELRGRRSKVVAALWLRARAQCVAVRSLGTDGAADPAAVEEQAPKAALSAAVRDLASWEDVDKAGRYSLLQLELALRADRPGQALAFLTATPRSELGWDAERLARARADLAGRLGWAPVVERVRELQAATAGAKVSAPQF